MIAPPESHWSLDKRVPVALILTMGLQLGGIVWWARGVTSVQEQAAQHNGEQDRRINAIEGAKERERVGERLSVLETEMRNATTVLQRIDERTQQMAPRR